MHFIFVTVSVNHNGHFNCWLQRDFRFRFKVTSVEQSSSFCPHLFQDFCCHKKGPNVQLENLFGLIQNLVENIQK